MAQAKASRTWCSVSGVEVSGTEKSVKFAEIFRNSFVRNLSRKSQCVFFFFKDFIYLFMRDTERGRDTGRGRNWLPAGSLMQDSIPGPQDDTLG